MPVISYFHDTNKNNILTTNTDIMVLSANPSLLAGSGVSGVIHKAAGPHLEIAAKAFAPISPGKAIITPVLIYPQSM